MGKSEAGIGLCMSQISSLTPLFRTFIGLMIDDDSRMDLDSSDDEIEIIGIAKPLKSGSSKLNKGNTFENKEDDRKPAALSFNRIIKNPEVSRLRAPKQQSPVNRLHRQSFGKVIDLTETPTREAADAAFARALGVEWSSANASLHDTDFAARDAEIARALDAQLREEEKKAAAARALHQSAMLGTATGKAWTFVEGILSVHSRLSAELQWNASPEFIKPVAVDDIVALTERLLVKQEEFRNQGKPCHIDLGFHYTREDNLESIQTGGLMTKQERDAQSVKAQHNGSAYGDGIYSANGPSDTWNQRYGNIGLIVARLQGQTGECTATHSQSRKKAISFDTGVVSSWAVLRSSSQCVALMRFNGSELRFDGPSCPSTTILKPFYKELQRLINRLLNIGTGSIPEEPQFTQGWSKPCASSVSGSIAVPGVVGAASFISNSGSIPASNSRSNSAALKSVLFQASENLTAVQQIYSLPFQSYASIVNNAHSRCLICGSQTGAAVIRLNACGHDVHDMCLRSRLGGTGSPRCPICTKSLTQTPFGKMPSGMMNVASILDRTRRGHFLLGISYVFWGDVQKSYHPNPGVRYPGKTFVAYLPDDSEGLCLLVRLKEAFRHGLTFEISPSSRQGDIVWGSIPHMTSMSGVNGFPDSSFFKNCNAALNALHVP